jgi:hypothetical protein
MHFDVLGERLRGAKPLYQGRRQNRPQIDHGRLQLLAFFLRAGGRPVGNNPTTSRADPAGTADEEGSLRNDDP